MNIARFPRLHAESEDFLHLDFLRIIAALGVVVFHWRASVTLPGPSDRWTFIDSLSSFVDMFFVISGFIICHVYARRMGTASAFLHFLRKRFARLAPLHYLTLAIYVAIGLAAPAAGIALSEPRKYDMACIVPNLLFAHSLGTCRDLSFNFPSWSISAEMACYLLFPGVLWLVRIRAWLPALFALIILTVLYALGPAGPLHRYWFEWTFEWSVWRALPAFALGISFYSMREQLAKLPAAAPMMFVMLIAYLPLAAAGAWHGLLTPMSYAIVACGVAADAQRHTSQLVRTLAPLGQLTYSVYMLHALFVTVGFTLVFDRILHLPPTAKLVAVIACLPLLFGVAYLSLIFFEQPARRWLSKPTVLRDTPSAV